MAELEPAEIFASTDFKSGTRPLLELIPVDVCQGSVKLHRYGTS